MATKKEDEKVTVVALLSVTHSGGTEEIRSFDKAWHRALEVKPAHIHFLGFVRKD